MTSKRSLNNEISPLPDSEGGCDFDRVIIDPANGKPRCVLHGAMNKVSPDGIWRCITTGGPKGNNCRAGCFMEEIEPDRPTRLRTTCPDGGTCHHQCGPDEPCFRVTCCEPLSGIYPNDEWPLGVR